MLVSTPCFLFSDPTRKRKANDFIQHAVFSTGNRQLQTVNGYKKRCFQDLYTIQNLLNILNEQELALKNG
jgi:hypothetical protein